MLWFRSYELKAVLVLEAVANNTIPLTIYRTYTQHARYSSDIASPSCLILCLISYELKTETTLITATCSNLHPVNKHKYVTLVLKMNNKPCHPQHTRILQ
jgi:hypothetical protein